MTWANLDDGFHDSPKVLMMGNASAGLLARCISYCSDYLTDGWVPARWIETAAGDPAEVQTLLDLGCIQAHGDRYYLPTYLEFNESRERVLARREVARRRSAMNADERLAKAIKRRDGNRCRYCLVGVNWRDRRGATGGTYDHVIPMAQGGLEAVDNLVVCCRACNTKKGSRTPTEAGMELHPPPNSDLTKPVSSRNLDSTKDLTKDLTRQPLHSTEKEEPSVPSGSSKERADGRTKTTDYGELAVIRSVS